MKWLVKLFDFGLHHQLYVESDLTAGPGDEAEETAGLGDGVAHGMPGDRRGRELELLHQLGLGGKPAPAERG